MNACLATTPVLRQFSSCDNFLLVPTPAPCDDGGSQEVCRCRHALTQTVDRDRSAATAHPTGWLGGFPTGWPWDFAWTAPFDRHSPERPCGAFVPDPFLGSSCDSPVVTNRLARLWVRRIAPRGGSLLAKRCATGGDVNPDCSLSGAFATISFGWPRRWPPAPAVPAIDCFARLTVAWKPDSVRQEPFPFSSITSVFDDEGNISRCRENT
jgi:hypothetical protein